MCSSHAALPAHDDEVSHSVDFPHSTARTRHSWHGRLRSTLANPDHVCCATLPLCGGRSTQEAAETCDFAGHLTTIPEPEFRGSRGGSRSQRVLLPAPRRRKSSPGSSRRSARGFVTVSRAGAALAKAASRHGRADHPSRASPMVARPRLVHPIELEHTVAIGGCRLNLVRERVPRVLIDTRGCQRRFEAPRMAPQRRSA